LQGAAQKLSFAHAPLDRLLRGGASAGEILLAYGEAATGKTTLCLQAALAVATLGKRTLYIDGDGSLSPTRLNQLAEAHGSDRVASIGIFAVNNFYEQTRIVEDLELYVSPTVGLIVVDSINRLYRVAITDLKQAVVLNKELNRQLAYLTQAAKRFNLPVLITSQARSRPGLEPFHDAIEPVAMRTLLYWAPTVVRLKPSARPGEKVAVLEKYRGRKVAGSFCYLRISNRGLE